MKPIATIGAGALVMVNDKVLLVQPNYGAAKGAWILPGGFAEPGEHPSLCALRELKEETGQEGRIHSPLCVRMRTAPTVDVYWVFLVELVKERPIKIQEEELLDAKFWILSEAIKSEAVRPMTRYFLEAGWPSGSRRGSVQLPESHRQFDTVYFIQ